MIDLSQLNDQQKEAVTTIDGPVIALAGAGSGKTRCLVYRISYMLDKKIRAGNILAVTFTNKAAGEMKGRIADLIGDDAKGIWIGTFHSICLRILKVHHEELGYDTFTIYDDTDQDKIIKNIIKAIEKEKPSLELDKGAAKAYISKQKSSVIFPLQALANAGKDEELIAYAQLYQIYQAQLKHNNAMDFDDLILNTYTLLINNDEIREWYQEKFKYIMIDESQDSNDLNFKLVNLFAAKYRNIFLCGDIDQSIYGFRNANMRNFLNFKDKYPDAKLVKIETNYRSTANIVNAANAVIANNKERLDKTCVSSKGNGRKIYYYHTEDEYCEAAAIASIVKNALSRGCPAEQIAILYRVNSQSRAIEQTLLRNRIAYNVISGISFFDRKEIKDMMAYIKLILNPYDSASFARIANVPKRGIGETSVDKISDSAYLNKISIVEQLKDLSGIKGIPKKAKPEIESFVSLVEDFRSYMVTEEGIKNIATNIVDIFERSGYQSMLMNEDGGEDRIANIEEFISMAARAEEEHINMEEFITNISLMSDQDALSDSKINLLTVHSSKGLEYDVVILAGANEGLFPHFRSFSESDVEEERRLWYVGSTRARLELNLTSCATRMQRGQIREQCISRFLLEIPDEYLEVQTQY